MAYPAPMPQQAQEVEQRRRGGRATAQGVIIRVDTAAAESHLFEKIAKQLLEPYEPEDAEARLQRIPLTVAKLLDLIMKHYVSTPLGGQILHPSESSDILIDRISQFAEILFAVQREYIREIKARIRSRTITKEEIETQVRNLQQNFDIISITLRELMNRQYVLLQINAPAPLRPPLANIKMGFDIVR